MITLTVYFEGPFWVGVFEDLENDKISTCRVVFGAEPKDFDIYELILKEYYNLKFSKPISTDAKHRIRINPKRMHRQINKALQSRGISTKAQQAIKLAQEAKKVDRKKESKLQRDQRAREHFEQKQAKKKQKKKGH